MKCLVSCIIKGLSAAREEQIDPLVMLGLADVTLDVRDDAKEIARYCLPLIAVQFSGQICAADKKVSFFRLNINN